MVKSKGLKSVKGSSLWQQTKTKNLNTKIEMVGMATVFTGSCPKLIEAYISLDVTFSPNLMRMVNFIVQNPQIRKLKYSCHGNSFIGSAQNLINCRPLFDTPFHQIS